MADDDTTNETEKTEEELAAEWEAAAAGEGDDGEKTAEEKALSQQEIDSLLGFDTGDNAPKSGIHALLDRALLSYERLPMLEVVFDRFVRTMSTSLRNFTSDTADVSIDSITSLRFEDYLNTVPLPALLTIFQAVEWENFGLISVDSSLTYTMVDVLLGGARAHRPIKIEGRPFTTIEQDIVKSLSSVMLDDMSGAFNPLTPITFRLERIETNPRFATITRPSNAVILITLRIDMDERGGKAEIVLPYATLEPVKDLLTQMFTGETFGSDDAWEAHFTEEVRNTCLDMQATLPQKTMTLGEIAGLKVGSTVVLDTGPNDDVNLLCKGINMMSGKIGSAGNKVAVKLTNVHNKAIRQELV